MVSGMIPAGECDFWGMPSVMVVSGPSELDLHEVGVVAGMKEAAPGHGLWFGQWADGHGDFVAGVAPGTVDAVLEDFVA